jgi:hypothetical protein
MTLVYFKDVIEVGVVVACVRQLVSLLQSDKV